MNAVIAFQPLPGMRIRKLLQSGHEWWTGASQALPYHSCTMQCHAKQLSSRPCHASRQQCPHIRGRSAVVLRAAEPAQQQHTHTSLCDVAMQPVMERGELVQWPPTPGVYAVYSAAAEGTQLQYIGLTRRADTSVAAHIQELPELTHAVKFLAVSHATKESLTSAWKQWVEEAVNEIGTIPPGNMPGETKWQSRAVKPPRPELRLTGGKGITGITVEQLVDKVVKDVQVVAFIKGTRTQPQCGFSQKMLTILNSLKTEYEVVNVLDEVYNPGVRDAIKNYSQWPTIPQLYVKGEFIGGSDITESMFNSGELAALMTPKA